MHVDIVGSRQAAPLDRDFVVGALIHPIEDDVVGGRHIAPPDGG